MNKRGGAEKAPPITPRIGSIDPDALKIPARRAESSLFYHSPILIFTLSQNNQVHSLILKMVCEEISRF